MVPMLRKPAPLRLVEPSRTIPRRQWSTGEFPLASVCAPRAIDRRRDKVDAGGDARRRERDGEARAMMVWPLSSHRAQSNPPVLQHARPCLVPASLDRLAPLLPAIRFASRPHLPASGHRRGLVRGGS